MNRHPNPHRRQTSDDIFSKPLLAYLGDNILLEDGTTIKGILHEIERTDAGGRTRANAARGGLTSNVYASIPYAKIRTVDLGSLAAQQSVVINGTAYFVANIQPTEKGWSIAVLEPTA